MSELKVTVQNLKNERFTVTLLSSDTVDGAKVKIEPGLANTETKMTAAEMRLIFSGKILDDGAQTLEDAKVTDDDLLVVMKVKKKKKKKKAKAAEPAPATAAAPATPVAASPAAPTTEAAPSGTPMDTTPETKASDTSSNTINETASSMAVTNDAQQEVIANLMAMGDYTVDQVRMALRCAWGNPNTAAEYLFMGIPPNVLAQHQGAQGAPAPPQAPPQVAQGGGGQSAAPMDMQDDAPPMGGGMGGMGDPAMLQQLQQNPQMMQALLQHMSQQEGGQEMIAQLAQNPEMLMQLLQMIQGGGMGRGGPAAQGSGGGPQPGTPGTTTITLTAEERTSIQNLMGLAPSISQQQAVEAFLACDRNEELAANFLLDSLYN
jgi:UV excision repair protein RAD23